METIVVIQLGSLSMVYGPSSIVYFSFFTKFSFDFFEKFVTLAFHFKLTNEPVILR